MNMFGFKTMDRLTRQLIEIALNVIENSDKISTPEKVTELMKEFEQGSLVDYIAKAGPEWTKHSVFNHRE